MTLSMDTRLQNFWVESINKEASLRFAWHLKYSKKFAKSAVKQQDPSTSAGDTAAAGTQAHKSGNSVSERIKKIERDQKKHKSLPAALSMSAPQSSSKDREDKGERLHKSDGALSLKDMRPPSQNTRSVLYNGISAHGEGRYAYLKKRKQKTPEDKYEFPILSSCQYGWKIMTYASPKSSPHARTCVIKDSFYRNSGIILG